MWKMQKLRFKGKAMWSDLAHESTVEFHGLCAEKGLITLCSTAAHVPSDPYVQDLTAKIKRDLEIELEAKVNKKVQKNMAWVLKKLGDANPDLKLDIRDFCPALSSEEDDNGTPLTQAGTSRYHEFNYGCLVF